MSSKAFNTIQEKTVNVNQETSKAFKEDLEPLVQSNQCCGWSKFEGRVHNEVGDSYDSELSWTIYLLVDLKVVYILTYAYITVVNLISSTANSDTIRDTTSMMLFNVSSEYMNVNVTSINDPILWNCREFSETSSYYNFLYRMIILAIVVIMCWFLITKLVALITVSSGFGCKSCYCTCSAYNHGLTKLWHIALSKQLIYPLTNTGIKAATTEAEDHDRLQSYDKGRTGQYNFNNEDTNAANGQMESNEFEASDYDHLIYKEIPNEIVERLSCKNGFRIIIPYILLFLLFSTFLLSFLSYDLHPLACITTTGDLERFTIRYERNSVMLEFSDDLVRYQRGALVLVCVFGITFLIFVKIFLWLTEAVIKEIQQYCPNHSELLRKDIDIATVTTI